MIETGLWQETLAKISEAEFYTLPKCLSMLGL